ncbi:TIM barrel protein [Fimbriiglobus ruber]|uniref:Xylose isomerase n=1 Tax=Fimbriiglobus ruber TaxID=1908690 RepID=A0A225DMU7_9BACT|nr:TIM barrel protein [Fimbriiglobus ruber]OWK38559.1 xylose isomerase [Fimbriiglobus ruber]
MRVNRREWLAAAAGSLAPLGARASAPTAAPGPRMGVVIHSYGLRAAAGGEKPLGDPKTFLDYCHSLEAGGIQTALGARPDDYADQLRASAAEYKMYVEGSIGLPKDAADVDRFTAEVRTTKRCGASLFRTVLMNGRRYEAFNTIEAFRTFFAKAKQSLALARPVVEKHDVRMAVENHKDLRAADQAELIAKQDSPLVGVCVDTGNNLALLENPLRTVEILAPLALTSHVKDMGVEEYAGGFLLSEVPLGTGFLDLPAIVAVLRKARPGITLNLEMITRDPLKIPCLTPQYWATLEEIPARQLAETLTLVRAKAAALPRVTPLAAAERVTREDENVRRCLRYAREKLGA